MTAQTSSSSINLEHVNITVSDPEATAAMLCRLFDWQVRWHGPSKMGGHTYHVGTQNQYLAVYTHDGAPQPPSLDVGSTKGGLNHVGIVVDDLDAIEQQVIAEGFKPYAHDDYEPGKRFYFNDADDIEFEVVSYC